MVKGRGQRSEGRGQTYEQTLERVRALSEGAMWLPKAPRPAARPVPMWALMQRRTTPLAVVDLSAPGGYRDVAAAVPGRSPQEWEGME